MANSVAIDEDDQFDSQTGWKQAGRESEEIKNKSGAWRRSACLKQKNSPNEFCLDHKTDSPAQDAPLVRSLGSLMEFPQ